MISILDIEQGQIIYARMEHAIHEAKITNMYSNENFSNIHYYLDIADFGTVSFEDFKGKLYPSEQDAINQINIIDRCCSSYMLKEIIGYPKDSTSSRGQKLILYAYAWDGINPVKRELKWTYDVYKKLLTTDIQDDEYLTFEECKNSNNVNIVRFEKPKYSVRLHYLTHIDYEIEANNQDEAVSIAETMDYDMSQVLENLELCDGSAFKEIKE